MNNLLSAMGYGDCLITLSLLEQLGERDTSIRVLGTGATLRVSSLLRKPVPVLPLIHDDAAFYTIKEKGVSQSIADFLSIRRSLQCMLQPGDRLGLERRILRNRLLLPQGVVPIWTQATPCIYDDRQELVRKICGVVYPWKSCAPLARPPRRVLLNPWARYANRRLDKATMENLLSEARRRGWELSLLDPTRRYGHLSQMVAQYVPEPALEYAATLLRKSDFYVGPDSFFMHLAYYFDVPFLGFFLPNWHVFMPPGVRALGNGLSFNGARDSVVLQRKLDEIGA